MQLDGKSRYTITRNTHQDDGSSIVQSVLRQALSLFQTEFSTEYDLVLRLSVFSALSFP